VVFRPGLARGVGNQPTPFLIMDSVPGVTGGTVKRLIKPGMQVIPDQIWEIEHQPGVG